MIRGSRLRQIGWAVVLSVCTTGFLALSFRVNAVKSEVRLAERDIVALEREKDMLETEFQTRASQQNLADWNRVEFGYRPPEAGQYIENERELAKLGSPRGADAPAPIRVAQAPVEAEESAFPAKLSPITGQPAQAAEITQAENTAREDRPANELKARHSLAERLGRAATLPAPAGRAQ